MVLVAKYTLLIIFVKSFPPLFTKYSTQLFVSMYLIISDSTFKKYLLIDLNFFFLVIEAIIGIFTPNPMAVVSKIDITF